MSYLTYIQKEIIRRLFDISNGYVFYFLYKQNRYNKTKTKELIQQACGINIFEDNDYKMLSQEKCINKILDEGTPKMIANLLEILSEYFRFIMGPDYSYWPRDDRDDFEQVQNMIQTLNEITDINLPSNQPSENLSIILKDIKDSIRKQTPELAIDRLHTFTCEYIRKLCQNHGLIINDDKGKPLPLHSLVGNLQKWYTNNNFCDSGFSLTAIKQSISLFEQFNHVRNDHSAAHPNSLLSKSEAEYVIRIVSDTLNFLEKIELYHNKTTTSDIKEFNSSNVNSEAILDEDLPFWDDDDLPLWDDDDLPF